MIRYFILLLLASCAPAAPSKSTLSDTQRPESAVAHMAMLARTNELQALDKYVTNHPELVNQRMLADGRGPTALFLMAGDNLDNGLELMMKHGADATLPMIGYDCMTPFTYAAQRGHVDVLREFLRLGVDINHQGPAKKNSDSNIPEPALEFPENDLNLPTSALDQASRYGRHAAVALLLENGAKLDSNEVGLPYPALHHAMFGTTEVATFEAVPSFGDDPDELKRKARWFKDHPIPPSVDNSEVIELLLAKGADLGSYDRFGNQALHVAIWHNASFTVKYLLENHLKEIDIHALGMWGETPLTLAARHARRGEDDRRGKRKAEPPEMIVELLLKHGADKNMLNVPTKGYAPQSAYKLAIQHEVNPRVIDLLKP